jgi:hypothetical protein
MWGVGRPGRWREIDLLLAEALHLFESGTCKACGLPLAHTTADDKHPLDFSLDSVVCAGCEILKSDAAQDPGPGELIFVNDTYHEPHEGV